MVVPQKASHFWTLTSSVITAHSPGGQEELIMPLTDIQHSFIRANTFSAVYLTMKGLDRLKKKKSPPRKYLLGRNLKLGIGRGKSQRRKSMNTFNTTGFRCNVSKELRVIVIRSLGPTKNVKKKKGKRNVSRSFQYKRSWRERTRGGNKTESEEGHRQDCGT